MASGAMAVGRGGTQPLRDSDHVVHRDAPLPIARGEHLRPRADDSRVTRAERDRQAIDQRFRVRQELPQGEIAVAAAERRIGVHGDLERARGEARPSRAHGRSRSRVAGGEIARRQAERGMAHEAEV